MDHLTQTLRKRSGVHHYNGVEVASVFDLVELSRVKFNEGRAKYSPCHIGEWVGVFEEAKARGLRLLVTVNHRLHTDNGPVPIPKEGFSETFFVAIEDFPEYLEVVQEFHKITGKRLAEGWRKAMTDRYSAKAASFAFNF